MDKAKEKVSLIPEKEGSSSTNELLKSAPDSFSDTSVNIVPSLLNHQERIGHFQSLRRTEPEEEEEPHLTNIKFAKEKKSKGDETTLYLSRRKIPDLMIFMMQQLLTNEPDDPVGFLQQLMDKCLMFRSGILCSAPLLFEDRHVLSLYTSFDPLGTGSISRKQYHVGLQTLGLKRNGYEMEPELQADGSVSKQTFLSNAKMALVESFMDMIMLPPPMEDGDSSIETFYH